MKFVDPYPPHRPIRNFLLRQKVKRNARQREQHLEEAERLRQQAQAMEQQGNNSRAQELRQQAGQYEQKARKLMEEIPNPFVFY